MSKEVYEKIARVTELNQGMCNEGRFTPNLHGKAIDSCYIYPHHSLVGVGSILSQGL